MDEPLSRILIMIPASMVLVVVMVLLHYEMPHNISKFLKNANQTARFHVVLMIFALFLGHMIEIWLFALAIYLFCRTGEFGTIKRKFQGDLVPVGPVRYLTAVDALTGLLLIAWSASFTFIQMHKFWKE